MNHLFKVTLVGLVFEFHERIVFIFMTGNEILIKNIRSLPLGLPRKRNIKYYFYAMPLMNRDQIGYRAYIFKHDA